MPNFNFNYMPLASTSSLQLPHPSEAATTPVNPASQQREQLRPPHNPARERARFFGRIRPTAARTPERQVDTQATSYEEELEVQRAITLSRASFVDDEIRRVQNYEAMSPEEVTALRLALENSLTTAHEDEEMRLAMELSLASSPAVEEEMRRAIKESSGMSLEEVHELREVLEESIKSASAEQSHRFSENRKACIRAFDTLVKGNLDFNDLSFLDVGESGDKSESQVTGMEVSQDDQRYSASARGVRIFRYWAKENNLEIVKTSDHHNNCMLDALMKVASGNYQGDFRKETDELKAMLVNEFKTEVKSNRDTLEASPEKKSFKFAVNRINEMFGTDMDVHVIQASHAGLPVFETGVPDNKYDAQDTATRKMPVILFNAGKHFQAVVAK